MGVNGDAETAKELKKSVESAWKSITKQNLYYMEDAIVKMQYGHLEYGTAAKNCEKSIIEILAALRQDIKNLPDYIAFLEKK